MEQGIVTGVVQTVASAADALGNEPQISRSRADVLRAAGSRYSPAAPLALLNRCMQEPGLLAFIGKPCDVAALRALSRIRPGVKEKFPYMLSFMCAGTPGRRGTEAVVQHMGLSPQEIVNFRYRGDGWPGMARAEARTPEWV